MHISVPDCEELIDQSKGSASQPMKYVSFNIHVNGTYHCSARFSSLSVLHEKLKREFGAGCLERFPGKQFFYLKPEQCTERRWGLQRWFQKIAQQPVIVQGQTFQSFLLNAQKEVQRGPEEDVQLEVYLVNGKSVKVDITSTDQTDDVLETVCSVLELGTDLTYYFGLYLVDDVSGRTIIRKLQDFESPYISLMRAEPHQRIQLRKSYWDVNIDQLLYDDPIALNLLYIEAIADLKNEFISVPADQQDALDTHRQNKARREFLGIVRTLPGYGFATFLEATCSYPERASGATVRLGHTMLDVTLSNGTVHKFAVQRMRCWRTYTTEDGIEMEFEYLFDDGKQGKMKWVKVMNAQTIHMAMCLQLLVEEMVRVKNAKPVKKPGDRVGKYKPKRQTNAKPDLTFLTSDPGAAGDDGAPASVYATKVTLSDLMAKVNTEVEEEDIEPIDFGSITTIKALAAGKEEFDSEEEDPRNMFASLAGL